MIKEDVLVRVECPACGFRLLDKGDEASGPVQTKCGRCMYLASKKCIKRQSNM